MIRVLDVSKRTRSLTLECGGVPEDPIDLTGATFKTAPPKDLDPPDCDRLAGILGIRLQDGEDLVLVEELPRFGPAPIM